MNPTEKYILILIIAASLSTGAAGVTIWQGYSSETELAVALLVVALLVWSLAGLWCASRPTAVHAEESIYGTTLRQMGEESRTLLRQSEADLM